MMRNRSAVLPGVVLAIMALPLGGSPSRSAVPVPVTFSAVADAWVDEAAPAVNYGGQSALRIDGAPKGKAAYLRFDVSGIDVPGSTVTLQVLAKNSNAVGHQVHPVADNDWGETTVSYLTAPLRGPVAVNAGAVTAGQWSSVDVTALVAGNGPVSLALTTTSAAATRYASREARTKAPRLVVEWSTTITSTTTTTSPATTTTTATGPPAPGGDPVLAAAGDIACDPLAGPFNGGEGTAVACRAKATSDLLLSIGPTRVASLGDHQYDVGTLEQFHASYDLSWGRLKAITRPAIGNHEIKTDPNGTGYFDYFGAAAGEPTEGYYSYQLGEWHIVVLNSNCDQVSGCGAGSPQEAWLRADLAAHPTVCTLAYWHHPRFSSGKHDSNVKYDAFWQALSAAGAEIVLNGHDHAYERFEPQTPDGIPDGDRGIQQFVVGTGGSHFSPPGTVKPNSAVRNQTAYGVLKLTLHDTSYDWEFVPEAGASFTDSGAGNCHP